jgi:HEAT repeat protein
MTTEMTNADVVPSLMSILRDTMDVQHQSVRAAAADALGRMQAIGARSLLLKIADDLNEDVDLRIACIEALAMMAYVEEMVKP